MYIHDQDDRIQNKRNAAVYPELELHLINRKRIKRPEAQTYKWPRLILPKGLWIVNKETSRLIDNLILTEMIVWITSELTGETYI